MPKLTNDAGIAMFDYGKVGLEDYYQTSMRTDADGRFEFESLRQGKYDVWAEAPHWLDRGRGEVGVDAGKTTTANLVFSQGGTVRVELSDEATGMPVMTEDKLQGQVSFVPAEKLSRQDQWPTTVDVAANGTLSVQSLSGKTRVNVESIAAKGLVRWQAVESDYLKLPVVEVVDGATVAIQFRVRRIAQERGASKDATRAATNGIVGSSLDKQGWPLAVQRLCLDLF